MSRSRGDEKLTHEACIICHLDVVLNINGCEDNETRECEKESQCDEGKAETRKVRRKGQNE